MPYERRTVFSHTGLPGPQKFFSSYIDTHRGGRENTKAVTIENCVIMQIVFPL